MVLCLFVCLLVLSCFGPAIGRGGPRGSGRLRPRIFLTYGTTRVVGRQPYAPAAFTPAEIPGTHFQGVSRPQGTWFRRREPRKKSPVTPPGIDPGTVRLVAQISTLDLESINVKFHFTSSICWGSLFFFFCYFLVFDSLCYGWGTFPCFVGA